MRWLLAACVVEEAEAFHAQLLADTRLRRSGVVVEFAMRARVSGHIMARCCVVRSGVGGSLGWCCSS